MINECKKWFQSYHYFQGRNSRNRHLPNRLLAKEEFLLAAASGSAIKCSLTCPDTNFLSFNNLSIMRKHCSDYRRYKWRQWWRSAWSPFSGFMILDLKRGVIAVMPLRLFGALPSLAPRSNLCLSSLLLCKRSAICKFHQMYFISLCHFALYHTHGMHWLSFVTQ